MKSDPSIVSRGQASGAVRVWWPYVAMVVVVSLAGGSIFWLLRPPPTPKKPPAPLFEVAGTKVVSKGDPVANALDLIRRYLRSEVKLKLPSGEVQLIRPAELGGEIDRGRLANFVQVASDPESAIGKRYAQRRHEDPEAAIRVPVPFTVSTEKAVAALVGVKAKVDRPASDAAVEMSTRQLRPEKEGYRMDVYGSLARIEAALRRGDTELELSVETLEPRIRAAQLGNVKFEHVLGYFETRYSRSARSRARTYNLRLAASKLDGTVLLGGQIFDFNETVGPRDEAHGYRVATVIAEGELVDGIGGGTCQISGTLHGASFFAGLDIVERAPHSRPSTYIKLGMDAAVAYSTINFRVRNPFDFPVVLHQTVKKGVVRAEILGPKRKLTVSFFRRIDEIIPFEEIERETELLPEGERILSQRGVPGFKVTAIRVVRDGAYAVRDKRRDQYPPTTQIVKVGTGPKDRKTKLKDDNHLEYTADEYLVLTQGPAIRTAGLKKVPPGGGMSEMRIPGRSGRRGWQQKAGMKVYVPPDKEEEETEEEKSDDKKPSDKKQADKKPSDKKQADKKSSDKKPD